ncbi:membrane protein [Pseudonocardia sulfidoxydans NBRC 16205]|uniref:Membrane protein n=1 Tax=Pseudonocardia sulfidoxydans NBRC 16205 TaxID=1223511 RepID=A0A511DD99_9PSEU|nr:DUF2306 domain-containing protein [Pseudonocardia sulfidoxydans]GEL22343.1 membrane protein [Pseudonocardia sulfidoxydans NBRC 16205]
MRTAWPVPVALVALGAIPLVAGGLRLLQLAGGPALVPADPRFDAGPLPVVLHVVGAAVFVVLGAAQFVPRLRRNGWHRRAGRVAVAAGLVVAGSALWLTLFTPPKPGTGDLLFALRLVFASAQAACLLLGVAAVRRRDLSAHRAWMVRAYAIALAAGTQVLTIGLGTAVFGAGVLVTDLSNGAGWVVNLAVAEWVVRRPARLRISR